MNYTTQIGQDMLQMLVGESCNSKGDTLTCKCSGPVEVF